MECVRVRNGSTNQNTNQRVLQDDRVFSERSKPFADACKLAASGKFEEAVRKFNSFSNTSKEYPIAQYLLGCAYIELGRREHFENSAEAFDKAIEEFQKRNEDIPCELFYKKAFTHWMLEHYDTAIANFTEFIKSENNESKKVQSGYLSRGLVYCDVHQYDKALMDLDKANQRAEYQTAYSLCSRGRVLALLRRYEDSEKDFHAALRIDAHDFHDHLQIGIAYSELGKFENAIAAFDIASKLKPMHDRDHAEICFQKAFAYRSLGNIEEAIRNLLESIDRYPEHVRAYLSLGRIYLSKGDYSKALENLNQAHEIAPWNSVVIYELANVHEQAERLELALHSRKQALGVVSQTAPKLARSEVFHASFESIEPEAPGPANVNSILKPSRQGMEYLKKGFELEQQLPFSSNRLEIYRQIIKQYEKAFDKGDCPDAYVHMSIFQENQQNFVDSFYSMDAFIKELKTNRENLKILSDSIEELKCIQEKEKYNRYMEQRILELKCKIKCIEKFEKGRDLYQTDEESNLKNFYETLSRTLQQCFTAFHVSTCPVEIISHNLEGPVGTISSIIKYLAKPFSFVPTFGSMIEGALKISSDLIAKIDHDIVRKKLSFIAKLGSLDQLHCIAYNVAETITNLYREQILRLDEEKSQNDTKQTEHSDDCVKDDLYQDRLTDRVALFAAMSFVEAIRDKKLKKLGSPKDNKLESFTNIIIRCICGAEPSWKQKILNRLSCCCCCCCCSEDQLQLKPKPPDTTLVWSVYYFFCGPGIQCDEGTFAEKPLMKPDVYGFRNGTSEEVKEMKEMKEMREKKNKKKNN